MRNPIPGGARDGRGTRGQPPGASGGGGEVAAEPGGDPERCHRVLEKGAREGGREVTAACPRLSLFIKVPYYKNTP